MALTNPNFSTASAHSHGLTVGAHTIANNGYIYTDPGSGINYWIQNNGSLIPVNPNPALAPTPVELPVEPREMPVIGYRGWNWAEKFRLGYGKRGALHSTAYNSSAWKLGQSSAACMVGAGHLAPDPNCACGLYVVANLDELDTHISLGDTLIVGAVLGWGRVVQHGREGWRAQHAKILALLDCKYSDQQLKFTRDAAKEYSVPVFERDGLERYIAEWGDPFGA